MNIMIFLKSDMQGLFVFMIKYQNDGLMQDWCIIIANVLYNLALSHWVIY